MSRPPTSPPTRLHRWGRLAARRPWRFVVAWGLLTGVAFAVAVAGLGGGGSLFSRLHNSEPGVAGESNAGRAIITAADPEASSVMLTVDGVDVASPAVAQAVVAATLDLMALDGVARVVNPYVLPQGPADPMAAMFLARSDPAHGFIVVTSLKPELDGAAEDRAEQRVRAAYASLATALPGSRTTTGSGSELFTQITHQIEVDLRTGEGIALPISFVVMVIVFGGFIAAGMPILGAIASIGGALAALYGFSYLLDLDASVVNVVTLLGLALCIDYGLLVVSRAREELRAIAQGRPARELTRPQVEQAVARTVATAGRTVLFSGLTVAISLAGLLVFEAPIIRAVAAAGVSVVLIAMTVGLTLVPALCAVAAHRLLGRGTEIAPDEGVFSRLARAVRRVPWVVVVTGSALLIVLALPTLSMRMTSSGAQLMPVGSGQRDFFDRLDRDYPLLTAPSVTVVTRSSVAEARAYADSTVARLPHVATTEVHSLGAEHAAIAVRVQDGDALGDQARQLVGDLRANRPADMQSWVSGQAAGLADFTASILARAPLAGVLVVLATFVLLFLMTGSVVIPTKALILNVLSLGASLGFATWVFQNGHLQEVLGFTSVGAIESIIPPLVLAFGFGLSMDYELFLISRIAELYHAGETNDRAVELGLQRSGRIITSAALLVMIVFGGFVAGKLLIIKQIGVALTAAVILDATIVRMLLVPATMTILGHRNWWAPGPLRRWHARHGITE